MTPDIYLPLEARMKHAGVWPSRNMLPLKHAGRKWWWFDAEWDEWCHPTDALNALNRSSEDWLIEHGYDEFWWNKCNDGRMELWLNYDEDDESTDNVMALKPTRDECLVAVMDQLLPKVPD